LAFEGADQAARAALVLDEHLLAELLRQLGGDRPREYVRAAAGRERIQKRDGFVRPGLRLRASGTRRDQRCDEHSEHCSSSLLCCTTPRANHSIRAPGARRVRCPQVLLDLDAGILDELGVLLHLGLM
jgi:hypothetical protein